MNKAIAVTLLMTASALAEKAGTWTGTITDSMCVNNHDMMNLKLPDAECVKHCVKLNPKAYKYILFDGKNQYKLSDQKMPEQHAAKKVTVKGTLFEKTGVIKVDSISPSK